MSDARYTALVEELLALTGEADWVEFKHDNTDAQMMGVRISALSNAARLRDKPCAYMLWGCTMPIAKP